MSSEKPASPASPGAHVPGSQTGSSENGPLSRLIAECLEHRDQSVEEIPYEEICRDHPELLEEVRESVRFAAKLPGLQAIGAAEDQFLKTILAARYRIDSRLGTGAMGVVYAATDLDLGRRVAIKVVHTRILEATQAMTRFDREATALAAISHDSVVTIYDRGITDTGAPFLVMELVDGIPCSEVLELAKHHKSTDSTDWLAVECGVVEVRETSLVRQMVRWAASLASGLEAAHAAGVYHRDVKPSNIMIRRDGRAVLLDFGIASMEDDASLTRPGSAVGTPAYMAPETLLGGIDRARPTVDVYGLAATLYHLLTLEAPYRGSAAEILTSLAVREPVRADKLRPGLPRDAQAILDHGMARIPGKRYASPGAMEKDLRALLAFQPVSVSPTTRATRAFRRLRRSKLAVGALLATLLMGGVLLAQEFRSAQAAKRRVASEEAYLHVPANLGIVTPANRVIADQDLREGVAEVLDRLVDAGHQEVTARTLRASFRLDHGDAAGAKADMRMVSASLQTEYARELSRRYEALAPESSSAMDLDLENLPNPAAPLDSYLAGYHAMRQLKYGDSVPLLGHDSLTDVRHAQELLLLMKTSVFGKLRGQFKKTELFAAAESIIERAVQIELVAGGPSAMTAHLKAAARMEQQRYKDCLALCEQGLELAPASHVILQNAADSSLKHDLRERAGAYLEQARRIVPGYLPLQKLQWKLMAQDGDYDGALALLNSTDFGTGVLAEQKYHLAHVEVLVDRALDTRESEPELSLASAEEALAGLAHLPENWSARKDLAAFAQACIDGKQDALFAQAMKTLRVEPLSRPRVQLVLQLWPHGQESAINSAVYLWVESLYETLSLSGVIGERPTSTSD